MLLAAGLGLPLAPESEGRVIFPLLSACPGLDRGSFIFQPLGGARSWPAVQQFPLPTPVGAKLVKIGYGVCQLIAITDVLVGRDLCRSLIQPRAEARTTCSTRSG